MEAQLSIHIAHSHLKLEVHAQISKYQIAHRVTGTSLKEAISKALALLLNQMAADETRYKRAYHKRELQSL